MTIPLPLQEALRDSITSGTFVDTKFWVFSKRRSGTGRVGGPKPLFVNAHVARRVPRLGALLDGCKNKENLRTRFPANRKPFTNNYDYEDDSDLEEDDENDFSDDEPAASPSVTTEKSGNNSSTLITTDYPDAKSSEFSDVISVSDMDSLFSESPDTKDEIESAHVGKVVIIEDVAFVTFQALLRYLYTNEIEFAPWGSTERRGARALEAVSESYGIPKPSPKSVYRLADKYNIPDLKELALQRIRQELSKCNIVEEAFSKYTSRHPELRRLEITQLAWALSSDPDRTIRSLKEKIQSYTRGELPHANHVISALYELMESDDPVEIPVVTSTDKQAPSGDWTGLKKSLTSSLTSGTFLDSQFYAVESKASLGMPKIRPLYFCSTVSNSFTSKLTEYSSKLKARKVFVPFQNGYDSDIGDEGSNQEHSKDYYPRSKCILESPVSSDLPLDPALLLGCGVAKTWSAVFLYVYTGQVTFAPICSQGASSKGHQNGGISEDETKPSQDQGFGAPPPDVISVEPCSPKSVYCLANKVGLPGLCEIAFKDIESKLDEKNIIEELFSPFTADHKDVREMEHELFQFKLKPLVDRALIPNIIESSSSGKHPHHAVTIGLILERSTQERHKRMSKKEKNFPQPNSISQLEKGAETLTAPGPQAQPPAPTPVSLPLPRLWPSSTFAPASAKTKTLHPSTDPSNPGGGAQDGTPG